MDTVNTIICGLFGQLLFIAVVNCNCAPDESPVGVAFTGKAVEIQCQKLKCYEALPSIGAEQECFSTFVDRCSVHNSVGAVEFDGSQHLKYKCCAQGGLQRRSNAEETIKLSPGKSFTGKKSKREYDRFYYDVITDVTYNKGQNSLEITATTMPCRETPSNTPFSPPGALDNALFHGLYYGLRYGLDQPDLCFSGSTEVATPGGSKSMTQLRPGDMVLSVTHGGVIRYEQVVYFIHRDDRQLAKFLQITLDSGKHLELTSNHAIYRVGCGSEIKDFDHRNTSSLVFARELMVGDCVLHLSGASKVSVDVIIRIEAVYSRGIYAPMTSSGVIVTNGIVASCFSSVKNGGVFIRFKRIYELLNNLLIWLGLVAQEPESLGMVDIPTLFGLAMDRIKFVFPF